MRHAKDFIFGLPFDALSFKESIDACIDLMGTPTPSYGVTCNLDFAVNAYRDDTNLHSILFNADISFADGMPVVWASRIFGGCIPERVAGASLLPPLLERCSKEGYRVFLMGGQTHALEKGQKILQKRYPALHIAGTYSPPFSHLDEWDNEALVKRIATSKTDLLFVFLGNPRQERWIASFAKSTKARLTLGLGASLDFITGQQIRAPKLLQRIGAEWIWRLLTNPKRLCKRYLWDTIYSVIFLLRHLQCCLPMQKRPTCTIPSSIAYRVDPEKEVQEIPQSVERIVIDTQYIDRLTSSQMGRLIASYKTLGRQGYRVCIFDNHGPVTRMWRRFKLQGILPLCNSLREIELSSERKETSS